VDLLRRFRSARALGLAVFLATASCVLVDAFRSGEKALVFSHRQHVQEEGLECVSCHESAEVEAAPGMPSADSCAVCHDQLDVERPPERAVANLFDEHGFRAAHAGELADEVRFDHLAHVGAVGDCDACHRGIAGATGIDDDLVVDMGECSACHEQRKLANECTTCHSAITPAWQPPNHALDWKRLHGRACRRTDPRPAEDCSLCHEPSTCEQCHRVEPPENHDNFFRLRGHAVVASIDRSTCATCHETATCDRCHADTLPLSHKSGFWGSARNVHCLTCHFPLSDSGCLTCHKATPSHATGPAKPSWHDAAMNCRSCHGATLPLSHVDDGSNCNLCHP